jgi:hypothetical protein
MKAMEIQAGNHKEIGKMQERKENKTKRIENRHSKF